jgi:DNA-binding response OmpR family regulator
MTETTPTRILVVEDDKDIGRALQARLVHEGYEVFLAQDAVSAISVARKSDPDIALLDINMPGGTGFDVARRIDLTNQGVAKIFITASKEPGLRQQAIDAGASAFVEKPFTAEALRAAIDSAKGSEPPELFQ